MQVLRDLEPGAMFWPWHDPLETIREVKSLGVRCGQLGMPGSAGLSAAAAREWRSACDAEEFTLVTVFAAYDGESYADIAEVRRTVGFIPEATRAVREVRTLALSDFAAKLRVPAIACHIGFVPEDPRDPDYVDVRDVVRGICDHAAKHGQTFALETGQEPARVLLEFISNVDRPNLRINFDPANMILYGTGDPIEALGLLAPYVASVHVKDGDWPTKHGELGAERPLGRGSVGIERFVAKLKEVGFRGPLNIEREVEDLSQRLVDMRAAVALLDRMTA